MTKELEPSVAVRHAKGWLASVYSDEQIQNLGLEEVRWKGGNWEITLGFDRCAGDPGIPSGSLPAWVKPRRDYKVVVVSGEDNSVIEMRNREPVEG